jgi:hypothetical protein
MEMAASLAQWVVDRMLGSELEGFLDDFVPGWLSETWGFNVVHYFPEPEGPTEHPSGLS